MARKPDARTFGQDLMRGEHVVGGGKESASAKGLTFGTTTDPYRDPGGDATPAASGTSIFDPVLCELAYRWFCPPGGQVLDPFSGGSVRGIVAAWLGRPYAGIDLRAEQVEANRAQWEEVRKRIAVALLRGDKAMAQPVDDPPEPQWLTGDSREMDALLPAELRADFIMSCPPYADLEVYSDDPRDLSTMDYRAFVAAYRQIIAAAAARLKPDRFACFVVGEVRDPKGMYRGFVPDTIRAFEDAGLRFYNEAILVTAAGSLPLRAGKAFTATRKLGRTHQNILVFCKGDPRKATAAIGEVEFGEMDAPEGEGGGGEA